MEPNIGRYYPSLDGLRGIAIVLVLISHYFNYIPGAEWGWVGVDLFFVLSGFLIAEKISSNKAQSVSIFYKKRINRIFPLYFLCTLIVFAFMYKMKSFNIEFNY